jgi:hypothetical protein
MGPPQWHPLSYSPEMKLCFSPYHGDSYSCLSPQLISAQLLFVKLNSVHFKCCS